ncbi:MAG: hypothetical protein OEZ24_06925 [Candidatus Bathyarchaeota archaeon]|nr:hypothetical protein [Candidatus Bathyarchaeota archaeon]
MKKTIALLLLIFAATSNLQIKPVSANSLEILSVVYPPSTPYNQTLAIDITVSHDVGNLPSVTAYYACLLNQTTLLAGWRIAPAQLTSYSPTGSVFTAQIPNGVYHESLPYNTKIVFYIEVTDNKGNTFLSCSAPDRWTPNIQEDKYVFVLTDPYPPSVSVQRSPASPNSEEPVTITANVSDDAYGSGVESTTLHYSTDGGRSWITSSMTVWEEGVYEGIIPAKERDTTVTYYVEVSDRAGNEEKSPQESYKILPSPRQLEQEAAQRQRLILIGSAAVAAILGVMVIGFRGRILPYFRERKMLTLTTVAILALIGWLCRWFIIWGYWWWALLIALSIVEFLSFVDPHVKSVLTTFVGEPATVIASAIIKSLTKTFEENPPTVFVAACYVLGFVGASTVGFLYFIGTLNTHTAYYLANVIAKYCFYLLAAGVVGQLAWVVYKERKEKEKPAQTQN